MMVEGKSDRQIQNELDLSLQNWHKNYPTNLAKKWREYWLKKESDEPMESGRAILLWTY